MRHLKKRIKKIFVPHVHNDYHPHIFRTAFIISIFVTALFMLGVSYLNNYFIKGTVLGATIATDVLIDLANGVRKESNIPTLKMNKKLALAAKYKTEDMITKQYFSHDSPDGVTPWFFIDKAGYNFTYAGENLGVNFTDEKSLNDAWYNSPSHRANLINSKFKDIGIYSQEGIYKGVPSVYVVQMFGAEAKPVIQNERAIVPKEVEIQTVAQSDNLIIAKKIVVDTATDSLATVNENIKESNIGGEVAGVETYSTLWERFIFNQPYYLQILYAILIAIFSVAFVIRIFVEYKKQHISHLILSSFFLVGLLLIAYFNYNFIFFF